MPTAYKDGLSEWHLEHARNLMAQILEWRQRLPDTHLYYRLMDHLDTAFNLREPDIRRVIDLITVFSSPEDVSYYRPRGNWPPEMGINFANLQAYSNGGEFQEYASIHNDPVIGGRWVQDQDEALILILGHELAHHIVELIRRKRKIKPKPHGTEFKEAYRIIRSLAINPMLDQFAISKGQQKQQQFERRITTKLQALKKMAEDETSNEHEAERALTQLNALLSKHNLTEADLAAGVKPHFIERTTPILAQGNYKPLSHLCWRIAEFCGVKALIHTMGSTYGRQYVSYFGAPSDVYMAVYLSELLPSALARACERYQNSDDYHLEKQNGAHHRTLVTSFRRGFIRRLNGRMYEAQETRENEWINAPEPMKALVSKRESALLESFRERHPRIGTVRSNESRAKSSESAATSGSTAANRINLNRPVERNVSQRLSYKS